MSEPKTMELNVEYVRKDSITSASTTSASTKKQIVVLHRGWVVVGDVERRDVEIIIYNAAIIRVWGTSKGLCELAESGANTKTKLDPCPQLSVPMFSVVLFMNVNEENWP